MIVPEIIERLLDQTAGSFGLVEGSAELASLGSAQPISLPAAYVFISEEAASENERVNAVLQRMEMDVSVVVITGNVSDANGAAAAQDIEPLKAAVRAALIGWQPASADDVITNVGGRLVRASGGLVWWELTFATAVYLEG
ncbi:hypothetical protein [Methylobacterium sp. WL6]|uniref:phage tail terminator protein n=1 Tax=Methylobacterium sp. WL6 TaxID=2603901 RepID=UPI0011C92C69|nr:hypothetical protein [Methylobacterium sp. WL6]TXN60895.1 hypothetical protein FV230_25050 [Methylobacterium sp. WL6]